MIRLGGVVIVSRPFKRLFEICRMIERGIILYRVAIIRGVAFVFRVLKMVKSRLIQGVEVKIEDVLLACLFIIRVSLISCSVTVLSIEIVNVHVGN